MNHQPPTLMDCTEHSPGCGAELFIVEGDSAAKSVSRLRDARIQAVLPMQGKPLNAYRAREATVAKNALYRSLLTAIGSSDLAPPTKLRYDRIILLFDPDADGIHCGVLVLLFFYRWLRPVLDDGKVYILRPPLFEIATSDRQRVQFAYNEDQYRTLCAEFNDAKYKKQRYRGLGSMNEEVLFETCLNSATRNLQQLSARDAELSLAIFGSKPR